MRKFTEYIGSQFGNPRGIIGKFCCLIMNTINQAMYKSVVKDIQINEQSTVLDIGYGNGYLIQKLYQKYQPNIFGIDISQDMMDIAIKRNQKAADAGKIKLSIGDCCKLSYDDDTFAAVTSVNTIYFWSNVQVGLSEIYRVLKKDGIFYNVVYSKEWLKKLSYTKKGFQFFDKEDLIQLGKNAGFSQILIKDIANGKSYMVQYKK
ncbi:MAG: Methylase involved in ubiquinone/menaquinone biosynthesis [Anaerocolumna sp.]|jgi:ubiquinone/menaquinone biosynthesis C-methylase UbiE|nr:Methylase involved in ubiquinone/menaquinone biosynthesis [Anaerocolumna sp.]